MPFIGRRNLAGYPAASAPAGLHPSGLALSVQLVAPKGGEVLILSLAERLETLRAPGPAMLLVPEWRTSRPLSGHAVRL